MLPSEPVSADRRGGHYDVLIVGGGIGGIYAAYRFDRAGFSLRVLESGGGVGGTWYWNRYPGARCDTDSLDYSYSFSPELEQDWTWSERYAGQAEILAYLDHVVDRFDLRRYFAFDSRVTSAVFDEARAMWRITAGQDQYTARHVVMATGFLSTPIEPDVPGLSDFAGDTYFASRWPHHRVGFTGKRVGVIGTGSSGIQLIPVVAREAAHVTVFQRTANYSVPAQNGPVDPDYLADFRARYPEIRAAQRESWLGSYWSAFEVNDQSGKAVSEAERQREFEWRWQRGGQGFMVAYNDMMTDLEVNRSCADFVRAKIAAIVEDPSKREALLPPQEDAIACKRLCVDTGYFEAYNQAHVDIVDLRRDPLATVEDRGVRTRSGFHACDVLILATGFDAFTGALAKIDIRGRSGVRLQDKWRDGPASYLGVVTAGFPNMYHVNGPLTAPGNFMTTTEMLVDRIAELVEYADRNDVRTIDTTVAIETEWLDMVQEQARSMPTLFACRSWLFGANVPGKPPLFLTYFGGLKPYHDRWRDIAADGYRGFEMERAAQGATV